jgi:Tfp pilus assembly protein PilF
MSQLEAAMASARHALSLDPRCAKAHNNLGNCLRQSGQSELAIAHYRDALAIRPNYVEGHKNLGVALADTGQVALAISNYRRGARAQSRFCQCAFQPCWRPVLNALERAKSLGHRSIDADADGGIAGFEPLQRGA